MLRLALQGSASDVGTSASETRPSPGFRRDVDIHREPAYDRVVELFLDPDDPTARIRAAAGLTRKRLGLRYALSLDARHVRGSHGRSPDDPDGGPVVLCPGDSRIALRESYAATEITGLLLRLPGARPEPESRTEAGDMPPPPLLAHRAEWTT